MQDFSLDKKITARVTQSGVARLPVIKNTIAIASGKGGVGKSTMAVNIAAVLSAMGAKVGILDADIYGPSVPLLLGMNTSISPEVEDNKMLPFTSHDLAVMSIGFHLGAAAPAVWRGPMASKALQQLFWQTKWPKLDYLIIDLPPGTGDIALTLVQKIPLTAAVVVTTPQDIAFADVGRAVGMLDKVNIPLLGIVENMSTYVCPHCNVESRIFGNKSTDELANQFSTKLLGRMPLDSKIIEATDAGMPFTLDKNTANVDTMYAIVAKIIHTINMLSKDTSIPITTTV